MENVELDLQQMTPSASKNGIMLGVVTVLIFLAVYMIDISLIVNWKFSLINFVVVIALAVILGRGFREEVGGYLSYGKSFQYGLVMFGVSSLIGWAFNIILFNYIDPELPQTLTRLMLETQEKLLTSMGASDAIIDETLDKLETEMPEQYSLGNQLKSVWMVFVGAAVYAAITAIFIKKSKPEFEVE